MTTTKPSMDVQSVSESPSTGEPPIGIELVSETVTDAATPSPTSQDSTLFDETSRRSRVQRPAVNIHHHHQSIKNIIFDPLWWNRLFTFVLNLVLLALSTAYCIAQLLSVELELVTECEPKTQVNHLRGLYVNVLWVWSDFGHWFRKKYGTIPMNWDWPKTA